MNVFFKLTLTQTEDFITLLSHYELVCLLHDSLKNLSENEKKYL